jgi:hypothetical protein
VCLVTIWITTCCSITCTKFILTARNIRNHQQRIIDMFGPRKANIEIRFTNTCIAISLTFILLWAPYGVAVITSSVVKDTASHCAVCWTRSISQTTSSFLPIVYISLDKRMQKFFREGFCKNEIHALASQSSS